MSASSGCCRFLCDFDHRGLFMVELVTFHSLIIETVELKLRGPEITLEKHGTSDLVSFPGISPRLLFVLYMYGGRKNSEIVACRHSFGHLNHTRNPVFQIPIISCSMRNYVCPPLITPCTLQRTTCKIYNLHFLGFISNNYRHHSRANQVN